MTITEATYAEDGSISAVIDGVTLSIPDDMFNRHRQMIAEWEKAGNKIAPYAAPKESVDPNDYPLKRWEFKAMVDFLGVAEKIVVAISAIPDPLARAKAMARYQESDLYRRDDPMFDQLAPLVGLTPSQIDAAWMLIAVGTAAQK